MTPQTNISPLLPRLPSGKELYDAFMEELEPELKMEELPRLEERFAKDTPEEKEARTRRYQAAFDACDRRTEKYFHAWKDLVRAYGEYLEEKISEEERGNLSDLESDISSQPSPGASAP